MQKSYRVRERAHDELLYDLLAARGVVGDEAVQTFLEPEFERDSHDPFLLPDMDKAVDRILFAKEKGEKICVWSDYDCDGIPGGVMLTQFLRSIGLDVTHYIPHRHKEGYGLNKEGIDTLKSAGIQLIITIDLGTVEVENIAYAQSIGVDIIVTDHHLVQHELPNALAILNPKRPDSPYPFDGLCGAGVAWKLVQGILARDRGGMKEGQEKWLLDLVGLATLSDMVPLVGENRMLARYGLVVMRRGRRPGLAALLSVLKIKPSTLTEDDIGFMVAPRINAASRMDSPEAASKLLASTDEAEAKVLAQELNRINDVRKGVVASIAKEANKRLVEIGTDAPVIVMGNPNWRPGVLGLVANTLVEAHGKPVFLWGREGGETIKGSCRSDGVINVVELMQEAKDVFLGFGGHHASGGFSLSEDKVHELLNHLSRAYETVRAHGTAEKEISIDRELTLPEISFAMQDLSKLAPFGEGNKKPLFIFPHVSVGTVRTFGKANDHVDAQLIAHETQVGGIAFFSTPESFQKPLVRGTRVDIVGHVEKDWKGSPRIRIVDVL